MFYDSALKYVCSFSDCELQFKRKDQLDSHEFTYTNTKNFKCMIEDCNKGYLNNAHLQRHIRNQHNPSKEIVHCKYEGCDDFFTNETKRRQHYHKVHPATATEFVCDLCSTKFQRKTHLKRHMFKHTGNYVYKCSTCDKGFLQLSHLKRHELTHSKRQCDLCHATFEKWSLLVAHKQKLHSSDGNGCPICKKTFRSKRALRHHKTTHLDSEERDVYQCTFEGCPKFFFQRKNMLAHYRLKHECRVFVCPENGCGQELSTKQKLKQHIANIHNRTADKVVPKRNKSRARRKDKGGVQKISTVSKIFNIILTREFEQAIISGNADKIYFNQSEIENDDEGSPCSLLKNVNMNASVEQTQLESIKV